MIKTLPRFNEVMKHIGFGKPSARIWFVGLEYHGVLGNVRKMMNLRKFSPYKNDHSVIPRKEWKGRLSPTPTWRIQAKIATRLVPDLKKIPWKEYLEHKQFRDGYTFLTNLFPLPMLDHNTWGKSYEKYVGGDKKHYYREVAKKRWKILRDTAERHSPALMFCFGKTEWKKFFNIFVWSDFSLVYKCDDFEIYHTDYGTTVVLTPFFVPYSFSEKIMEKMFKILYRMKDEF